MLSDVEQERVLLLLGGALTLMGLLGVLRNLINLGKWQRTVGVVTGHGSVGSSSDGYLPTLKIEFDTPDGKLVRFETPGGRRSHYKIARGQCVPVLYDPANPSEAMVNRFSDVWAAELGVTLFGLLFLGIFASKGHSPSAILFGHP